MSVAGRATEIGKLTGEAADDPAGLRITITVEAGAEQVERIEANLEKLVDVLLVESSESNQEHAGEVSGIDATKWASDSERSAPPLDC